MKQNRTHSKKQLAAAGASLAKLGFHAALAGNLSLRLSANQILCTRHGADKMALDKDDFVICNLAGEKIEGVGKPTSEINMHCAVYRNRNDIQAVIHAHPPIATAFAAVSQVPGGLNLPEMMVLLGPVTLVPYATPGSEELGRNLEEILSGSDAFILENHGCLTIGENLGQAACRMELLEQLAKMTLAAKQLGKPFQLANKERQTLLALREKVKGWGNERFTDGEICK